MFGPYDRSVKPELVDVYISYLRKKIEVDGLVDPIQTVRSVGYVLESYMLRTAADPSDLLYFLAGILLVAVLGGTTYGVLYFYFQTPPTWHCDQNGNRLSIPWKHASLIVASGRRTVVAEGRSDTFSGEEEEGKIEPDGIEEGGSAPIDRL